MLLVAFPLKTPRMVRNRLQFERARNPWQARGFGNKCIKYKLSFFSDFPDEARPPLISQ
jgi:hypothetical protein